MTLTIQIKSLIFSFFFGITFEIILNFIYFLTKKFKFILKSLVTFLYSIGMSLLYFFIIRMINNGIIHIYMILVIIIGFILSTIITPHVVKILKK